MEHIDAYENQYIALLSDIIEHGVDSEDRTGIGTKRAYGKCLKIDISKSFPMITTRRVSFKIAFWETMMFLKGITDTKFLEERGINIWKGNTSRRFLDSRNMAAYDVGEMGKGYSYQWRRWDGRLDQIKALLAGLQDNPFGRRHLVTAWNPSDLDDAALPPCHVMQQYAILPTKDADVLEKFRLHSSFVMRSSDTVFGLPYNIMSYALINKLICTYININISKTESDWANKLVYPGTLTAFIGDAHIYNNQIPMVLEQISRFDRLKTEGFSDQPELKIEPQAFYGDRGISLKQLSDLKYGIEIYTKGYKSLGPISCAPAMAV